MEFAANEISGVYEITLEPHEDERGFFMRTYDEARFAAAGLPVSWVQENHSFSREKGTVRGLHYQRPPHAECKVMRVVTGELFLAVVDLRKGSETFGKWTGIVLSEEKRNLAVVPRGCANGICTLTENCQILYKMDNAYEPSSAGVIAWDDPDLAIDWPLAPAVISEKDRDGEPFAAFAERGGLEP